MKLLSDIKKNPFLVLTILVIAGVAISNRMAVSSLRKNELLEKKTAVNLSVEKMDPALVQADNSVNAVSDGDFKKYGMSIQGRYDLPQTQEQWDATTQKALSHSSLQGDQAFRGKELSAVEYKRRLDLLNQQIKEYQQKVQMDPLNTEANQKLQNLYMLKSTLTNLREEVVNQ